jgi:hypothetical protein
VSQELIQNVGSLLLDCTASRPRRPQPYLEMFLLPTNLTNIISYNSKAQSI